MAFRIKNKQTPALRYFVYVSDLKLQMYLDQIAEPARREIVAELKFDLKLVSLALSSPATDRSLRQDSRAAKLAVVEEYFKRHESLGDLTSKQGYFTAEAEMDWEPLDDDETVLFCGYAEKVLVVLGGSISHVLGRPSSRTQIGSHPPTIRAAVLRGDEPSAGNLGSALEAAARATSSTPQMMRFLARVISRGPLSGDSAQDEYLLGTPLYVEAIDASVV